MARKDDQSALLQQYAISREISSSTSSVTIISSRKGTFPQSTPQSSSHDKLRGREDHITPTPSNMTMSKTVESGSASENEGDCSTSENEGSDGNGGDDDEDEEDEEDGEEAESFAPSEPNKKRGHQTGLSVSLAFTTLGNDLNSRKRARCIEKDECESPSPKKASRPRRDTATSEGIEDDDNYDAVDLISETDDEEDLEREEEKIIIDSEEEHDKPKVDKHSRSRSSSAEGWDGFPADATPGDAPFFDEHFGRTEQCGEFELHSPTQLDDGKVSEEARTPPKRRVRFVDESPRRSSSSSTSGGSEIDADAFPDLFLQQDRLDPTFRRMIENDNEDGERSMSDGEGSYWDLNHFEDEDFELEKHGLEDDSSGSGGSSSGYDSDMGETTDEEILPPTTVNRPQSLLRLNSSSSQIKAAPTPVSTPVRRSSTANSSRSNGPSMGSWIADPTKPIAIIDKTGKNIIFYPAKRPKLPSNPITAQASSNSSTLGSPTTTTSFARLTGAPEESENDRSDGTSQGFPGTLLPAADFMMSGLFSGPPGNEHIHPGQVVGPPQAFYSFRNFGPDGDYQEDEDDYDYDDDCEKELNMDDFIDFGDATSGSEAVVSDDNDAIVCNDDHTPDQIPLQAPIRIEPRRELHKSPSDGLLEHFDQGVVSSFRRNQNRHQNLLRRPLGNTNLYAIKGGRHITANNPISPLRKRKANHNFAGPLSPFAGVATKRRINYMNQRKKKTIR